MATVGKESTRDLSEGPPATEIQPTVAMQECGPVVHRAGNFAHTHTIYTFIGLWGGHSGHTSLSH